MYFDNFPQHLTSESTREIAVSNGHDVHIAIDTAQKLLIELPFPRPTRFLIATAVSELARNLIVHASGGVIRMCLIEQKGRRGFEVVSEDEGQGIADISLALTEGYSTANSLGLGLPGVQRIMDELHFDKNRLAGIRIVARKWV